MASAKPSYITQQSTKPAAVFLFETFARILWKMIFHRAKQKNVNSKIYKPVFGRTNLLFIIPGLHITSRRGASKLIFLRRKNKTPRIYTQTCENWDIWHKKRSINVKAQCKNDDIAQVRIQFGRSNIFVQISWLKEIFRLTMAAI